MSINTEQWSASVGPFVAKYSFLQQKELDLIIIFKCFFNFFYSLFLPNFVLRAGDIELNPGSNKKSYSYFSCCHWNVNSFPTENYCKVAKISKFKM